MSGVGIHPGSLPGSLPFHLGGAFPVAIVGQSSPSDPPRNFLLGPTHDLVITTNLVMVTGLPSVAQDHKCCLLALALFDEDTGEPSGEYFLDLEGVGLPWFRDAFKKNPSLPRFQETIRRKLLSRQGTREITSMQLKLNRPLRDLTIDYVASTDFGELVASVGSPPA